MKAFLINPWTRTIEEIQADFDKDYQLFYKHLTEPGMNLVDTFTSVRLSDLNDSVYIDDEGMLKPGIPCFAFQGIGTPLAGRGIVVGTNEVGDTVQPSSHITLDWLRREVVWLGLVSTGEFGPTTEGMIQHPVFGSVRQIRMGDPILSKESGAHDDKA